MSESTGKICTSWWCRTLVTFVATLIGLLSFFTAFMSLLCNENHTAQRAQSLAEGENVIIERSIKPYYVDKLKEGKLVHLIGKATTTESLTDDTFNLIVNDTIKLRRIVEMYQWNEFYNYYKLLYQYEKVWAEQQIESSEFDMPKKHHNPQMPLGRKSLVAQQVIVEKFTLSATIVEKMEHYQSQPVPKNTFKQVQQDLIARFPDKKIHLYDGGYYIGQNPYLPQIGDLRIRYEAVPAETISVIAKQEGSSLVPYQTKIGGEIELFEYGTISTNEMFLKNRVSNLMNGLPLRVIGFFTLFLGFYMALVVLNQLLNFPPLLDTATEQAKWALFTTIIVLLIFMIGKKFGLTWLTIIALLLLDESFFYLVMLILFMFFSALANNLSDSKEFLEKQLKGINWISLMIITTSLFLIMIAFIWMDYLPKFSMVLIVMALILLPFLKSAYNLFEKPPLELPEPMLVPETKVPNKKW